MGTERTPPCHAQLCICAKPSTILGGRPCTLTDTHSLRLTPAQTHTAHAHPHPLLCAHPPPGPCTLGRPRPGKARCLPQGEAMCPGARPPAGFSDPPRSALCRLLPSVSQEAGGGQALTTTHVCAAFRTLCQVRHFLPPTTFWGGRLGVPDGQRRDPETSGRGRK